MSDSNQLQETTGAGNPAAGNPPTTGAANPAAAPSPAAAPAAPQAPKTFTQRFQEIERSVYQMQYVLQFHSQILQNMLQDIKETKEGMVAVKEVINANMKLAADQQWGTQDNIALKVTQLQADAYKQVVEADLAANRIRVIDALKDGKDLVVYSTPDTLYGYQLLETFKDEQVRKDLMGKKAGDKVGEMTVIGVYEEVPAAVPPTTPGASDAQTQDPAQQPQ